MFSLVLAGTVRDEDQAAEAGTHSGSRCSEAARARGMECEAVDKHVPNLFELNLNGFLLRSSVEAVHDSNAGAVERPQPQHRAQQAELAGLLAQGRGGCRPQGRTQQHAGEVQGQSRRGKD